MNLFNSKKGGLGDYLVPSILFITLTLSLFISTMVLSQYSTTFQTTSVSSPETTQALTDFISALNLFDGLSALLLVSFVITLAVSSYRIASPPIFFILTIIYGFILGFINYLFTYVFVLIAEESVFSSILVYYPILTAVCTNLQWVGLLMIVIGSITLYAKKDQGQYI